MNSSAIKNVTDIIVFEEKDVTMNMLRKLLRQVLQKKLLESDFIGTHGSRFKVFNKLKLDRTYNLKIRLTSTEREIC
jgi:hypothetical protein